MILDHYKIIRIFWGTAGTEDAQWDTYKGLGELYISNQDYNFINGKSSPEFAEFMRKAMGIFVEKKLI